MKLFSQKIFEAGVGKFYLPKYKEKAFLKRCKKVPFLEI